MLTETLALLIHLPPGPFGMPKALVCGIHDLGRVRSTAPPLAPRFASLGLDPQTLRPDQDPLLVNKPVDALLFLAVAYAGRATRNERSWAVRTWQATGAVAPVTAPPGLPPARSEAAR